MPRLLAGGHTGPPLRTTFILILAVVGLVAAQGSQPGADWGVPAPYRGRILDHRRRGFRQKLLAITIDDGPDPVLTPRNLDTLKAHGAHATFFVLGQNAARHPELLRRMVAEGHAVGSHTYTHALHPDRSTAEQELARTAAVIQRATGRRPVLFRPSGGSRSSWTTRLALQQGYVVVLWTISSADTATHSPDVIANNIIHTPSPGDIALMHDSATKAATAQALPRILDELGRSGWRFVTVPELMRAWDAAAPHGSHTPILPHAHTSS